MSSSPKIYRLLVKTHSITRKKYLCVTKKTDYERYKGSGTGWKQHLKQFGNIHTTDVLVERTDLEVITSQGIYYSNLWNIVESTDWMNRKIESGLDWMAMDGMKIGRLVATGKIGVFKRTDSRWYTEEIVHPTKGMVPALSLETGIKGFIIRDEFWENRSKYHHSNENTVPAFNVETSERGRVDQNEFWENRNKYSHHSENSAPAILKATGESLGRVPCDDPRWETGEIMHPNTNLANAVLKSTGESIGKVPCDDPRWETGEIIGCTVDTVPAILKATGESLGRVPCDDPRWETGEIIHPYCGTKNAVLKSTGESIGKVPCDDSRWETGEIIGSNVGRISVYDSDGKRYKVLPTHEKVVSGEFKTKKQWTEVTTI